jgi:hypothetical protein
VAGYPRTPGSAGVLHFCPFAKYAVAFPRMSRSIFTRANSARKRLISICSALTLLLPAPFNRPSRCALTQLYSVCSTTPRTSCCCRDALARFNQSNRLQLVLERVLRSRCLCHLRLLALFNHSAMDTFCAGNLILVFLCERRQGADQTDAPAVANSIMRDDARSTNPLAFLAACACPSQFLKV